MGIILKNRWLVLSDVVEESPFYLKYATLSKGIKHSRAVLDVFYTTKKVNMKLFLLMNRQIIKPKKWKRIVLKK